MKVEISAIAKDILHIEVDADLFGELFAAMAADEQAEVLKSMVNRMNAHPMQWDYIVFELERPAYAGVAKAFIEGLTGDS